MQAQQKIQSKLVDRGGIYELINRANKQTNEDPASAITLIQEALEKSFAAKNRRAEGFCYNSLGAINYKLGRYELSIANYQKSIGIFRSLNEAQGLYNSQKYLGISYDAKGDTAQALVEYLTFKQKAEALADTADIVDVRNRIARIYLNQGKYKLAEQQYAKVQQLEQVRGNIDGYVDALNGRGWSAIQQQDTSQGLGYYNQAAQIAEEQKAPQAATRSYDNLSKYYQKKGDEKNEIKTRKRALRANKQLQDKAGEATNNLELGKILVDNQNSQEAIPYLQATIDLADELGQLKELPPDAIAYAGYAIEKLPNEPVSLSVDTLSNALSNSIIPVKITPKDVSRQLKAEALNSLGQAYEQQGNYKEALANFKESQAIADSLSDLRDKALLAALDATRALTEKDEQLREMEQARALNQVAIQRQQSIILYLLIGLAVLMVAGLLVIRSNQAKRRANKLLALRSLRSQMNPHFIFNSLNSINSFISKNDDRSANKYLSDFSRLMRTVMENSSHDFVPLREELRVLELYLGLEHFRFKDKFDFTFEVDEEIDASSIEIPPMLIQPYIENSIWHGLRYKQQKGHLNVSFSQQGKKLICVIEDNGIGRARSLALKTKNQKAHSSTGLKNTAQRLQLINSLYSRGMRVDISDVNPTMEDVGTRVMLVIPHKEAV